MKFLFGAVVGIVLGMVTLVGTVGGFIAGIIAGWKMSEEGHVKSTGPGHVAYRGMSSEKRAEPTTKDEETPVT